MNWPKPGSRPAGKGAGNGAPPESGAPRRKPESLAKLKKAARKLFAERGYHATRPQDITREAGLGHGTFYLHYEDKRACFLAFVEDARVELHSYIRSHTDKGHTLEGKIAATLNAIYDFADANPGVLTAAMADEAVIDTEGMQAVPLMQRWGHDWSKAIRDSAANGTASAAYDADIIGQAIVGAIQQCRFEGDLAGRRRQDVVDNLTRFIARALRP